MSEADKSYELKVFKMIINKYLDESTLVTEENLSALETNRDQVVWNLATKIYSQSGHKVDLNIVQDIVNSRIGTMKYELSVEKVRIAEQACRIAEQKVQQAAEEARRFAAEEARWRVELESTLAEFGEDKIKAQIFHKLCPIICEQLSVDFYEVTLDSHISHDLRADEVDTVELAMAIEEAFQEFEVEISEDLLGSMKRYTPSHYSDSWSPSGYSNSLGDYDPVACTVRELLLFIHEKVSSFSLA